MIKEKAPSHFHMIFDKSNPYYRDLPGLSVLIGGMWINNLNYWGCNQYITQRALGRRSYKLPAKEFCLLHFLKLLIPLIVVIPGITMYRDAPEWNVSTGNDGCQLALSSRTMPIQH